MQPLICDRSGHLRLIVCERSRLHASTLLSSGDPALYVARMQSICSLVDKMRFLAMSTHGQEYGVFAKAAIRQSSDQSLSRTQGFHRHTPPTPFRSRCFSLACWSDCKRLRQSPRWQSTSDGQVSRLRKGTASCAAYHRHSPFLLCEQRHLWQNLLRNAFDK